ncbi:MAG TPA: PilZ domain-containing protein [Thermoanaerobaculia bacterium]|nr:PilZ domain-containing protein [Thermoanaerobaculia bacterium]
MKKAPDQQRNAERIPLTEPIDCTIDAAEAKIVELSLIGAKIEHFNRLSMNSAATVQFKWHNKPIKLKGKVARTEMRPIRGKPGYVSGVNFADVPEKAPQELRWLMSTFVESLDSGDELPAPAPPPPPPPAPKKAAPPPPPPPPTTPAPFLAADDEVEELEPTAELSPYLQCIYREDGGWDKIPTTDPKQPISGFTILTPEDEKEIDDFCRTYEMADPETQRMIRLSFELGIAQYRRK